MANAASPSVPSMRFGLVGAPTPFLEVRRRDALDLLAWLGLERPEFGAVEVRRLLPLCRRRLWLVERNVDAAAPGRPAGTLRALVARLAGHIETAPAAVVQFG